VTSHDRLQHVAQAMLPQLDSAYNLARWLVRDAALAEEAVRDAYVRAAESALHARAAGTSEPAWLLGFVRASCHARLDRDNTGSVGLSPDAIDGDADRGDAGTPTGRTSQDGNVIDGTLAALPVRWRECIVLHDIEGLSYADLARIIDVPLGTVVSRLVDARRALRQVCALEAPAILQEAVEVGD
jgi:RNA polymerase sigma-70 factor, ECF subfamily